MINTWAFLSYWGLGLPLPKVYAYGCWCIAASRFESNLSEWFENSKILWLCILSVMLLLLLCLGFQAPYLRITDPKLQPSHQLLLLCWFNVFQLFLLLSWKICFLNVQLIRSFWTLIFLILCFFSSMMCFFKIHLFLFTFSTLM